MNGHRPSQQSLYQFTYVKLGGIVALYVKDDAERDWVFNQGMLKIFNSIKDYTPNTNYLGWARTILVRSAIDFVRSNTKKKATILHLDEYENNINEISLNSILDTIHEEALIGMIQSLKDEERIVFTLFEIEGYSHSEIEGLTKIKQNTSKWLLSKARSNLINIYRLYNKISDAKNVK